MTNEQASETKPHMTRDAIGLLTQDHRKAQAWFREFERIKDSGSPEEKFEIARKVCGELLIHMEVEEAIFYRAVREKIGGDELMKKAETEHKEAKRLIRHIGEIDPTHAAFVSKLTQLAEAIEGHVEEEERVMFPKALVSGIDLTALGEELHAAKNDMRVNLGLPPEA
ncbi:MAG TPA: hemerythrin domain-containing protein [Paucimonas sp.]|nr:hemerythrin domain-containing protein [Paucimonas sp.]